MKYLICAALLLALAACAAPTGPVQVTRAASPAPATALSAGQVLNAMRLQNGLAPMRRDATLTRIAQAHAEEMARTRVFSHKGRDGRGSWQRAQAAGYNPRLVAENIAWGPFETAEVLRMWQARADHRTNQMHPRANEYGLGIAGEGARTYWVLVVGRSF